MTQHQQYQQKLSMSPFLKLYNSCKLRENYAVLIAYRLERLLRLQGVPGSIFGDRVKPNTI